MIQLKGEVDTATDNGTVECDIAVIGAGPAGLSFARLLAGSGLSVTLVERAPEAAIADPAFDGREIALTHRSQDILQGIGAWGRIPVDQMSPLRQARVQDGAWPSCWISHHPARRRSACWCRIT